MSIRGSCYSLPGGGSSSVLNWGARLLDLAINAACASGLSGGGASVRVATGWPTRVKNSSWPAGAHMHNSRDGVSEALVKECGALAGTLMVCPARATMVSPRNVTRTCPVRTVNISSKSCRCGGGPPPGGTCMSMRVYLPAVSWPATRIVYVSPTSPICGRLWSESGRATVSLRDRSSGGTGSGLLVTMHVPPHLETEYFVRFTLAFARGRPDGG